jgi:radical SAM superfamily enzyme YgiQ (UPF0313 family)
MKTILLVNSPKFEYGAVQTETSTELDIDNSYPVGLLSISASIKQNNNQNVNYIDANFYHMSIESIARAVEETGADYIGLNVTFPNMHIVEDIADILKLINPRKKIIVGGPAATLVPEYLLGKPSIDFVTVGEGEKTIVDLLDCLDNDGNLADVDGIAYREDGEFVRTAPRAPLLMQDLPLIDVDNIPGEIKKYAKEITLFTSRGCQSYCNFCSTPIIWGIGKKHLRNTMTERIFQEIENYREHGFDFESVHFLDDSFTNDWEKVNEFIDYWNQTYKDENLTWRCLSRVRAINEPSKIEKMVNSGCSQVSVGVESATPRLLKEIGKALKIEEVDEFLGYCADKPLTTKGFFMIGFPGETEAEVQNTLRYIENSSFDQIAINIVMAYPGTRLYRQVYGDDTIIIPEFGNIDLSKINSEQVRHMMRKYSTTPRISLSEHVPIKRLYELKEQGYQRFYSEVR